MKITDFGEKISFFFDIYAVVFIIFLIREVYLQEFERSRAIAGVSVNGEKVPEDFLQLKDANRHYSFFSIFLWLFGFTALKKFIEAFLRWRSKK